MQAKSYLRLASPGDDHTYRLTTKSASLAEHPKWEVRKAVAETLGYGVSTEAKKVLENLIDDVVPYVKQSAIRALRDTKRITTKVYEKKDPTAERLFNLIRKINPRNMRESYAAAMQVGQIYYRELAGITAHELRTSLYYINTLLNQLLTREYLEQDSECEDYVSKIRKGMDDLLDMLSSLSDLTTDPQNVEIFEAVPIIEQSIEEAGAKVANGGSGTKDIISHGLWGDVKLEGDPVHLKMALRNLIINAIEASSSDKSVHVTLTIISNILRITIKDEGCGMTDQDIINAFKYFSSLKKTGMGLGIPIAQKIIHFDMCGEIRYESEVDKGTQVFVDLPINREIKD